MTWVSPFFFLRRFVGLSGVGARAAERDCEERLSEDWARRGEILEWPVTLSPRRAYARCFGDRASPCYVADRACSMPGTQRRRKIMNVSYSLVAAAVSGILLGAPGCGGSQTEPMSPAPATSASDTMAAPATSAAPAPEASAMGPEMGGEKHACKGQNECKGKGNCKTDKHACKGQNECKGQGGCKG